MKFDKESFINVVESELFKKPRKLSFLINAFKGFIDHPGNITIVEKLYQFIDHEFRLPGEVVNIFVGDKTDFLRNNQFYYTFL